MQTFKYKAYGISVESEIECPELMPGSDAPDLCVRYGPVADRLEDPVAQGPYFQISCGQLMLNVEHVGRFLVTNGDSVLIERAAQCSDEDVRCYLLGSVFGAVLHQRGILPLHASAIQTCNGAVAFTGAVGHGKSTIAAKFYERGYRVLSDDVCAITLNDDGAPVVAPGFPQLNLLPDSLEQVGRSKRGLRRTRKVTEKYGVSVSAAYSGSSVPLHTIYSLCPADTAEPGIEAVTGRDKIALVRDNTYRHFLLNGIGQMGRYAAITMGVVQRVRIAYLVRPTGKFLLDELASLIEKDLGIRG